MVEMVVRGGSFIAPWLVAVLPAGTSVSAVGGKALLVLLYGKQIVMLAFPEVWFELRLWEKAVVWFCYDEVWSCLSLFRLR